MALADREGNRQIVGAAAFSAYPSLQVAAGPGALAAGAGVIACALAPFLDRRGIR